MDVINKMDTRVARDALRKSAEKYYKVSLSEKDFQAIFKLFGDAIEKTKVYEDLIAGHLFIESIGVGKLVITDNCPTPSRFIFTLPVSLI